MMKNQLIFLTAIVALVVSLTACGNNKNNSSAAAVTPPPTTSTPETKATPSTAASSDTTQQVKLIASAVTFKYDKTEYHVKKGIPVKITLENKDGLHGAKLADFNINLNNGNPTATFTPDKTGTFQIKCSVPCGTGHMDMTANLIVE
jgi:cytochrome c oxidase subunit 2